MKLVIPPPIQGIIIAITMWAVNRYGPGFDAAIPGLKTVAIGIGAVGFAMEIIAVATFFRAKTTVNPLKPSNASKIVSTGLFSISRNPMYLALLLVLVAWGLWLANPLNLLLIAGWVVFITEFQIKPEEKALKQKFGAEYDAYCERVRRWV